MKPSFGLLGVLLLAAGVASASHPSITPGEAVADRKETFTLWVPVTGNLERVEIKVPSDSAGKPILNVEFVERPTGWTVETKKAGDRISEIRWDAPKSTYRSGDLVSLRFMAETPAAGTYKFDVERHQTGEAEAHGAEEKEAPPEVKVVAKPVLDTRLDALSARVQQAQTSASQAQTQASQASDAARSPLGAAGVALGLLALVLAGVGLVRKKS